MKRVNKSEFRQSRKLVDAVISKSINKTWDEARHEWKVIEYMDLGAASDGRCICGRNDCRHIYVLGNIFNDSELAFIGEDCVRKFDTESLKTSVDHYRHLRSISYAFSSGDGVRIQRFTPEDIEFLWKENVFPDNEFNGFNSYNDVLFLKDFLDRYRLKDTREKLTDKQIRKAKTLLGKYAKPYLLKNKIIASKI